jgi:hypothetical protein
MFVAERFLLTVVKDYGKRPVSTDGGGTLVSASLSGLSVFKT